MKTIYCTDAKGYFTHSFVMVEPYCSLVDGWVEGPPVPEFGEYEIPKLVNGEWVICPNYMYKNLWSWHEGVDVDVGIIRPGMTLEELEATDIPPPTGGHSWDMASMSWKINPDKDRKYRATGWNSQLDKTLKAVNKSIHIYQDAMALGETAPFAEAVYKEFLRYRIEINRLKVLDPIPSPPAGIEVDCCSSGEGS